MSEDLSWFMFFLNTPNYYNVLRDFVYLFFGYPV